VTGDYTTAALGGGLELGFKQHIEVLNVNPFIAVKYDKLRQQSYSESDPTWGNRYNQEWVSSLPVSVGLRLEASFANDSGLKVNPSVKYAYAKETETARNVKISALPSPGCECSIDGVSAPEHTHKLSLGLKAQWNEQFEANARFNNQLGNDFHAMGGDFSIAYKF
jgi:outer membrane autotransporter protein